MANTDFEILQVTKNFIKINMFGEKLDIDKGYLRWALGEVIGWQKGRSNFTARLMGLIAKADNNNKKKFDLVVMDELPAKEILLKKSGLKILDGSLVEDSYGIVVRKGNDDLLEVVNRVIKRMQEDGSLKASILKHTEK